MDGPSGLIMIIKRFCYAMYIVEHVLGVLVEVDHVVPLDVHLLQLPQLASKVSSVAYQIHILYMTGFIW